MNTDMYIVCWVKQSTNQTTDISPKNKDKYQVFADSTSEENKEKAEEFYNKVLIKIVLIQLIYVKLLNLLIINMKSITIRNQQYYYKVIFNKNIFRSRYATDRTLFYLENSNNPVFQINFNIESPFLTKEDVSCRIEEKLKLQERKLEIQRGEII